MGGNSRAINRETGEVQSINGTPVFAQKLDLRVVNRRVVVSLFTNTFINLSSMYAQQNLGNQLWELKRELFSTGLVYNGSSEHLFNDSISDEEFVKYKPLLGDIDITVDGTKLSKVFDLLILLEGKIIYENVDGFIRYIGQNKSKFQGEQINSVFELNVNDKSHYVQVDFEGVVYENGVPDEFSKFGHSSDWYDITNGIKGVAHKFLIMNLVRGNTYLSPSQGILLTNGSIEDPNSDKLRVSASQKYLKTFAFSITKGLRKKVRYIGLKDSIPMYKELSTSNSIYQRDLVDIFQTIFNVSPKKGEMKKFRSFIGVLELIQKYFDVNDERIARTFDFLLDINLFGNSAQRLDRDSMKVDFEVKYNMLEKIFEFMPQLKTSDRTEKIKHAIDSYYTVQNYFKSKNINKTTDKAQIGEKMSDTIQNENALRRIIQEEIQLILNEDSKLNKTLSKLLKIVKETVGQKDSRKIKRVFISSDGSKWVEIEIPNTTYSLSLNLNKDEISYGTTKIEKLFKIKSSTASKEWLEHSNKLLRYAEDIKGIMKIYAKMKKSKKIKTFIEKEL